MYVDQLTESMHVISELGTPVLVEMHIVKRCYMFSFVKSLPLGPGPCGCADVRYLMTSEATSFYHEHIVSILS